jgi:hypothetical protein
MDQNKGYYRVVNRKALLFGFLLLVLGMINPGIPAVKANVYPENALSAIYPVDIFNASFSDSRIFTVKQDIPVAPPAKKGSADQARPKSTSDQCYIYEGHRSFADRGPETALIALSGLFFSYPLKSTSLISHLPFIKFSAWTGNSIRIRPPPIS